MADFELPLNKEVTYFARTNFRNTDRLFGIKRKDRRQHTYVLGKSGTGKSVLLENMIVQNIRNGEGVCVVDPHGELVEHILKTIPPEREKDVVYFNPADTNYHIGFNVLETPDPKYKHLVASGLMGIFTKIWANAWSSRMEYILNNAILALLDTPGTTMLGIPRLLVDKDYRQKIISNVKDPVVRTFWVHEYEAWQDRFRNEAIAPIQNKVGQFLSTSIIRNVVGQSKSTINIFDIMNDQKIFLVNVSKGRIGEDNSALLGGMLVTKIQLAAMERVRISEEERKDFYLYVDEFQNFVTDSFAGILSEARKYRLCLTLAHQYIAQLETEESKQVRDAVFGNVGTMIIFRVGAADAEYLETEFEPEFTAEDFVMLPNYHVYVKLMIDGVTSRPFSATTLSPLRVHPRDDVAERIIDMSRTLYTRPRKVVEEEINQWSGMVEGGDGSQDEKTGEEHETVCSVCGKKTTVPFKPIEGLPVYCKTCHAKVRSGEIEPVKPNPLAQKKNHMGGARTVLANMGIEYTQAEAHDTPKQQKKKKSFRTKSTPARDSNTRTGLRDVLTQALRDVTPKKTMTPPKEEKEEHKPSVSPISLQKLKHPAKKSVSHNGKDPTEKNINLLKSALQKVTKNDAPREKEPPARTSDKREVPEDVLRQILK